MYLGYSASKFRNNELFLRRMTSCFGVTSSCDVFHSEIMRDNLPTGRRCYKWPQFWPIHLHYVSWQCINTGSEKGTEDSCFSTNGTTGKENVIRSRDTWPCTNGMNVTGPGCLRLDWSCDIRCIAAQIFGFREAIETVLGVYWSSLFGGMSSDFLVRGEAVSLLLTAESRSMTSVMWRVLSWGVCWACHQGMSRCLHLAMCCTSDLFWK